jgi:hypothetical protein
MVDTRDQCLPHDMLWFQPSNLPAFQPYRDFIVWLDRWSNGKPSQARVKRAPARFFRVLMSGALLVVGRHLGLAAVLVALNLFYDITTRGRKEEERENVTSFFHWYHIDCLSGRSALSGLSQRGSTKHAIHSRVHSSHIGLQARSGIERDAHANKQ